MATFGEHLHRAILDPCDFWAHDKDITYGFCDLCHIVDILDSWELGFMIIIVSWQLRATLESRVFHENMKGSKKIFDFTLKLDHFYMVDFHSALTSQVSVQKSEGWVKIHIIKMVKL